MANPQPDKFVKISLELFEAIMRTHFSGTSRMVFDYIIRMTYGFQKKTFETTQHKIARELKITQPRVCDALQWLENRKMIINTKNRLILSRDCLTILGIQKDYDRWGDQYGKPINPENRLLTIRKTDNHPIKDKRKRSTKKQQSEKRIVFIPPTGEQLNSNGHGWVDAQAWDDFVQFRKEIKKPLTETAVKKNLEFLSKFKNQQKEIIDTSIRSRWQGLFPPKNQFQSDECDGPRSKILRAPDGI